MLVPPRMLSILTTRRCTAACDHCCVGAGPHASAAIPVERIHRLIDEATRIPSLELIGFTGGECFLLGRDLDELVGHASAAGFTTRAISNGYWARDRRAADERIGGLRARGLDELVLSTGTFHQRFVIVNSVTPRNRNQVHARRNHPRPFGGPRRRRVHHGGRDGGQAHVAHRPGTITTTAPREPRIAGVTRRGA